jgi:hypothetical protein
MWVEIIGCGTAERWAKKQPLHDRIHLYEARSNHADETHRNASSQPGMPGPVAANPDEPSQGGRQRSVECF